MKKLQFSDFTTVRMTKQSLSLLLVSIINVFLPLLIVQPAYAASLTEASIRLDRVGAAVAANGTNAKILVVFKPASTATEAKLKITWPTTNAFTVDATAANHTVTDTGIPSTYHGESLNASGITSPATAVSGGDVTYTIPDLTAGTLYGFYITGGITNPSNGNAGTKVVAIETETSGSAQIDVASVAVDTVGTSADQVTLTASVDPTFNFALSGNSISLGTLSTTARSQGNVTVDVDTNANNGYVAWIRSEGAAKNLASASTSDSISSTDNPGSCVTATIGSKGYVVDVNSTAGSNPGGALTVAAEYNCTDGQAGGVIDTAYEQIADRTGVVDSDTLTLNAIVTISATTKAATDYTDTWEVVGAGDF